MTFDELHELAAAYALGALEPVEAEEFETHLAMCERCRREIAAFSGVVEELARADAVVPPPKLRKQVLDEIARTPQTAPPGASDSEPVIDLTQRRARRADGRSGRLLLAAAAVVVVIGGAIGLLTLADQDDAYDDVVAASDAETLQLDGEIGMITVVYSPGLNRVGVLGADLPDPGAGRTYELWLFVDGGVVTPAGLFTPDDGEVREVLPVDDVETSGFGVTIEPEGGSEQPTGAILFSGDLET